LADSRLASPSERFCPALLYPTDIYLYSVVAYFYEKRFLEPAVMKGTAAVVLLWRVAERDLFEAYPNRLVLDIA
jgi:hypothetical protein